MIELLYSKEITTTIIAWYIGGAFGGIFMGWLLTYKYFKSKEDKQMAKDLKELIKNITRHTIITDPDIIKDIREAASKPMSEEAKRLNEEASELLRRLRS